MSRAFLPNQTLGEYRIEDFLGMGGMGEVYRASHVKIGRQAAVKVLTQATRDGGGFVERFFNEARIQANLQHPNIATLYDFCEHGGQPCIIMEYVDGQTVAERIEAYGPLPLSEALYVFEKVVEAIEYVHRHGVIHRDIKSNNIKVSSAGMVKLLDFGIAKGQMSPGLTEVGSVIGTLHYLAPEQIRGGVADNRSDIWALGVLLYEMVTGKVPFEASTIGDLCDKIKSGRYEPPTKFNPGVPRAVCDVIARCLKENPAARYQNAADLLGDTKRLISGLAAVGPSPSVSAATAEWADRNGGGRKALALFAGAVVAVVLLLLAGVVVALLLSSSSEPANGADTAAESAANAGVADFRTIELHASEGRADVYRDGKMVGSTPYTIKARLGERIRLTLKREGYVDEPVDLTVSEKKVYTFTMSR